MSSTSSSTISKASPQDPNTPITLVMIVLLVVVFLVGFFSIYCCRCFIESLANSINRERNPNANAPSTGEQLIVHVGLDSSIVNSFPTFTYSSVKDYCREKYGLECAICLCEFEDSDVLRLLTNCCHVFHQGCIDLWFQSHKSCPICRRNLDEMDEKESLLENTSNTDNIIARENDTEGHDHIELEIKEETSQNEIKEDKEKVNCSKFSRSHSTGHSILQRPPITDDDKYKLQLPKDIQETITNKHFATLSCTTFGEYWSSSEKHQCFGEISGFASSESANADKEMSLKIHNSTSAGL